MYWQEIVEEVLDNELRPVGENVQTLQDFYSSWHQLERQPPTSHP